MDISDGEPWTEMDIEDLTAALRSGSTIEDAAQHLCRSGTVEDVRRNAEELKYKSRGGTIMSPPIDLHASFTCPP